MGQRLPSRLAVAVAVGVAVIAAAATVATFSRAAVAPGGVPRLAHIVVVVFENHERSSILDSRSAPTITSLADRFAQATSYHGVAHPSLPNYLALVSGSTHGVTDDCTDCPQRGPTIGTQLTAAGRTWGAYAEGYPSSPRFAVKHVPFLYFPNERGHVHPLTAFHPAHLPAFSFVVPDLCNDMHDCAVGVGDRWLKRFIAPLLRVKRTAVFIVFDEGTTSAGGGGLVPLIIAGTAARPRSRDARPTNHYSLLRTVEDAFGLRHLGSASRSRALTGIWK